MLTVGLCCGRLLHGQWAALVSDHTVLSTQPPSVVALFTSRLFPTAPRPAVASISKYVATAWPHVLAALCTSLAGSEAAGRGKPPQPKTHRLGQGEAGELSAVELQLLMDASHLAISRASHALCDGPDRQVSGHCE